jgi:ketosteroid isomerase-like protein
MTQENVEIARRLFEAVSRGDYDNSALPVDPDVEWHNTASFPGPRTVRGATAVAQFLRDMFQAYGGSADSVGMEIEEIVDVDDAVVIGARGWWRASASGLPFDTNFGLSFRFRNGKLVRGEAHRHYRAALKAVGLGE